MPDQLRHERRPPATIDEYLAKVPAVQRDVLQRLRELIRRLAPQATETIGYGMPGFKLDGRGLVWFAAWKSHCSIYPLTDSFLEAEAEALRPYRRTKGSVHFTPDAPLPDDLVERLVLARVADIERGGR